MSSRFRMLCSALFGAIPQFAYPASDTGPDNYAPFLTESQPDTALTQRNRAAGPFYEHDLSGDRETEALRPLLVRSEDHGTETAWTSSLYPLFTIHEYPDSYRWNVFELLVGSKSESETGHTISSLDLWPVFWHYDTGVREESYDAVFPLAGRLRNRLFFKRIDWFVFPVFLRLEQPEHVDTCILWPVFRHREGENEIGWAMWPLYGHFEGEGKYDQTYAIWPLFYDNYRNLPATKGGGRMHDLGVLPFYASESAPGLKSETWVWPFFGYTSESAPRKNYGEVRYLYPFWVRGRGEEKNIDRWLPFYAHQTQPDYAKTWYAWPLLKQEQSRNAGLDISKDTLLYFIYKNEVQTVPGRDFKARKTQLWPLFGYSDDGAGQRQFMFLNPFEPLISGNEMIRQTWTPFFAVYRFEANGEARRYSLLWDLVLYQRDASRADFSIGPLFERSAGPEGRDWKIGKGLLEHKTTPQGKNRWGGLWGLF